MSQIDLLDTFINALHCRINKKSDLVNFIADSLNIEKESVYRRLNKKVYFSVTEVGLLSAKLGISIDRILNYKYKYGYASPPAYTLYLPKRVQSIDSLIDSIEINLKLLEDISKESTEFGQTFLSLPIEFVIRHNNLLKFIYFKWGYYYTGSKDYDNFSLWQIPERLLSINNKITEIYRRWKSITYLWDMSSIWCLVKDIEYFNSIHALNPNDTEALKCDLHKMLYNMEQVAAGISINYFDSDRIQIYISTVQMGGELAYYISNEKQYSSFHTYFIGSKFSDDRQTCMQVHDWIDSMKKVCTLISNSGAKERTLFFNEQHQIVDNILMK